MGKILIIYFVSTHKIFHSYPTMKYHQKTRQIQEYNFKIFLQILAHFGFVGDTAYLST